MRASLQHSSVLIGLSLASALVSALGCSGPPSGKPPASTPAVAPAAGPVSLKPPSLSLTGPHVAFPLLTGGLTLLGTATPGTATFTGAPRWDEASPVAPAPGGGSFSITVDGTTYPGAGAESFSTVLADTDGSEYLILGAAALDASTASVVYLIVPKGDFAVGSTVALDGADRLALFATGPADNDQPTLVAAATSGSVTFTAGGLAAGETVSATLSADFAKTDWTAPSPSGPTQLVAGSYQLKIEAAPAGATNVECEGTLSGQESAFTTLSPAAVGFADGAVTLALGAGTVTVTGATLAAGFGESPLQLFEINQPDVYASNGWLAAPAAGPSGTSRIGASLLIDGSSASAALIAGQAAVVFEDTAQTGYCTVLFAASLTAP